MPWSHDRAEANDQVISSDPVPQASGSKVIVDVTKRDGGKCRITGLGSSILDPLVVTSIVPRRRAQFSQVNTFSTSLPRTTC